MRWAILGVAMVVVFAVFAVVGYRYISEHGQPAMQFRPPAPSVLRMAESWVQTGAATRASGPGNVTSAVFLSKAGAGTETDAATRTEDGPCNSGHTARAQERPSPGVENTRIGGSDLLTNTALSDRVGDRAIRDALAYAYTCSSLWRKVADAAASRGTGIRWEALSSEVSGMFYPSQNVVVLNPALRSERAAVLAATVAHEVYHASHDAPSDVGATLQEEIDAYGWEAYVWSQFATTTPRTAREAFLDDLVGRWQARELNNFVVTMPGYQRNLFGRVLESP